MTICRKPSQTSPMNKTRSTTGILQISYADKIFAMLLDMQSSEAMSQPGPDKKLLPVLLSDSFCSSLHWRREGCAAKMLPLEFNENGILTLKSDLVSRVYVPHCLNKKLIHISHHNRLVCPSGRSEMYSTIRKKT